MGLTKVLSQRGQACAPLLALPTGEFESKVLGGDRVWVVEWIVRTCVPRWLASTNTAVHCRQACL